MARYSVQPRERMFVNGYGFLYFAKNISKNIGKNVSHKLNSKNGQKLVDHAKQSAIDFKTANKASSKRVIQKNSRSN